VNLYQPPNEGDLSEIKIEVTRDCPLACIHCSSNATPGDPIQLSRDLVLSLVTQAASMGVKSIVFSGGEPLVWPWLADAVAECSKHKLRCSLYSTGIDRNGGERILASLEKCGLHRVIFSLYSPYKQQHEQVTRRAGSYEMTISAVRSTRDMSLLREIHFVPLRHNYRHLEELVKLAQKEDVKKVSILRLVPHGRGIVLKESQEMLGYHESVELREIVSKCQRTYGVTIRVGSPYNVLLLGRDAECDAARHTLIIGPSGNVYPCDAFKNIEPVDIGLDDPYNSVVTNPLRECWEKSKYLEAIRRYLSTPFDQPCVRCAHLECCKSGCLAQKVLHQGSILGGNIAKQPDPLCLRNDHSAIL